MVEKNKQKLKSGFTTGSCSAVTAKAAWLIMSGQPPGEEINLLFPDGKYRKLLLKSCELRKNSAIASIIKDAGDDPDITDQAIISTELKKIGKKEISPKDHILKCGKAIIVIRGGDGVGIVTKPGLEPDIGKWAINPIPLKMISANLKEAGCGKSKESLLFTICIKNGKKLAEKTLNPLLGVKGGLSILGTTGIVEPKSHAAYIKTIEILLKGLSREGGSTAVLCTGSRTKDSAMKDFPALPEYAFIRIGDFISDSLHLASSFGFKKTIVCCMPGKLFKYSSGHEYTHAHKIKLDLSSISDILVENHADNAIIKTAMKNVTFRGLLKSLDNEMRQKLLKNIGEKALSVLNQWSGDMHCELRCYGYEKNIIGIW